MLQDRQDSRQGTNWSRIPNRSLQRRSLQRNGRLKTGFHNPLYTKDDVKWELQGIILLTPLLVSQISRFWTTRCFGSATLFKVDAMRMPVRYGAHDAR
jgi:hypothetical protein